MRWGIGFEKRKQKLQEKTTLLDELNKIQRIRDMIPKILDDEIYQSLIEHPEKWRIDGHRVFRRCRVCYWMKRYDEGGNFICKILDSGSFYETENLVGSGYVSEKTGRLVRNMIDEYILTEKYKEEIEKNYSMRKMLISI